MRIAAVAAGAPDGCVQVVTEPSIPLVDALMSSPRVSVRCTVASSSQVTTEPSAGRSCTTSSRCWTPTASAGRSPASRSIQSRRRHVRLTNSKTDRTWEGRLRTAGQRSQRSMTASTVLPALSVARSWNARPPEGDNSAATDVDFVNGAQRRESGESSVAGGT